MADRVQKVMHPDEDAYEMEARLAKFFEICNLGQIDDPATIMDIHGMIITWQLPGILFKQIQVSALPPEMVNNSLRQFFDRRNSMKQLFISTLCLHNHSMKDSGWNRLGSPHPGGWIHSLSD
jgi:hypothetical protein